MKKSFGERFKSLFTKSSSLNEDFYDELLDLMVEGDIGAKPAYQLVEELEALCDRQKFNTPEEITLELKKMLLSNVKSINLVPEKDKKRVGILHIAETIDFYSRGMIDFYQIDRDSLKMFNIVDENQYVKLVSELQKGFASLVEPDEKSA